MSLHRKCCCGGFPCLYCDGLAATSLKVEIADTTACTDDCVNVGAFDYTKIFGDANGAVCADYGDPAFAECHCDFDSTRSATRLGSIYHLHYSDSGCTVPRINPPQYADVQVDFGETPDESHPFCLDTGTGFVVAATALGFSDSRLIFYAEFDTPTTCNSFTVDNLVTSCGLFTNTSGKGLSLTNVVTGAYGGTATISVPCDEEDI